MNVLSPATQRRHAGPRGSSVNAIEDGFLPTVVTQSVTRY
jgi:hypothetical protein